MLILRSAFALTFMLVLLFGVSSLTAQTPPMLKRTTTKNEKFDFSAGGTIAIVGAPTGSIHITGSAKNEIEIVAAIEIQAETEADLAALSAVTTYLLQEGTGRIGIISSGTHNKLGDKKLWRKFPKKLFGLPFRIDYTISVPRYSDLQIDGGKGDIAVAGVEGAIVVNSVESNAKLDLIGGGLSATFGTGTVSITMPDRSWRGSAIEAQLVKGTMAVHLPANLSAELDASILKSGQIENTFSNFKPRTRTIPFNDRSILAKAGSGGVAMKFTVGDGTLKLLPIEKPN